MEKETIMQKIKKIEEEIQSISEKINSLLWQKQELENSVSMSAEDLIEFARKLDELKNKMVILNSISDEKMEEYLAFNRRRGNKYILRKAVMEMPEEMKPDFAKNIDYSTFSTGGKRDPKILFGLFLTFIISIFLNVFYLSPLTLAVTGLLATSVILVAVVPTKEEKNKKKIENLDNGIESSDIVSTLLSLKQKAFVESVRDLAAVKAQYETMISKLVDIDINVMTELLQLVDEIELLEYNKEKKTKEKSELEECAALIDDKAEIDSPKKLTHQNPWTKI